MNAQNGSFKELKKKYCFSRQMIENHSNEFENKIVFFTEKNEFSKRFGKNFRFFLNE